MNEFFAIMFGFFPLLSVSTLYLFFSQVIPIPSTFSNTLVMRIASPLFFGLVAFVAHIICLEKTDTVLKCVLYVILYFYLFSIVPGSVFNAISGRTDIPLYLLVIACFPVLIGVFVTCFKKKKKKKKKKRRSPKTTEIV